MQGALIENAGGAGTCGTSTTMPIATAKTQQVGFSVQCVWDAEGVQRGSAESPLLLAPKALKDLCILLS